MSSTRNKRKRPENDPSAIAPASRRRSRGSRAAGEAVGGQKNDDADKKADPGDDAGIADMALGDTNTKQAADGKDKNESVGDESSTSPSLAAKVDIKAPDTADPGAGSSQDSSTPKQPLHIAEAATEAPNSSEEDPDPDSDDRRSMIQDLIAHRSLLLSRIRLCRNAATKRLSETSRLALQNTGNKQQKTGVSSREMTDDEEIHAHREMSKLASQAAKRAREAGAAQGGEGSAEQRTSLSLRRGSSVGKRMNAALSVLAPGVAPAPGSGASSPVPMPASSTPSGKTFPPSHGAATPTTLPPGIAGKKPPVAGMPQGPAKSAKSASVHGHAASYRQSSIGGVDAKQTRPALPGGKTFKSSSGVLPRTSSTGKVDQMPASFRPIHPHPNMPPRMPQPKTQFSEAMALRRKRDSIQAKLRSVLERQKVRIGDVESLRRSAGPPSILSRFSSNNNGLDIDPRVELPKRRKTHWDHLLSEMSWLAADFIEERKWKMSLARTLSSAVESSDVSIGSIAAARKSSAALPTKAALEAAGEANKAKTFEEAITDSFATIEEKKYLIPSLEDLKAARKVGRLASCMISELIAAVRDEGSMGNTDNSHAEALARYKKVKAKLLSDVAPIPNDQVSLPESVGDNPQCGDVEMEEAEKEADVSAPGSEAGGLTFSEINNRISNLGTFNGKKGTTVFKEFATALIGKKLNFSDKQKEMVEFVDKTWALSSAGVLLTGLPTSGKTVATCSLLWKRRMDGPQLIICPPASLLRWKYEINLFKELRAWDIGFVGGIACAVKGATLMGTGIGAGDVVVCEYSSVDRILPLMSEKGLNFQSLCIDCRHPEGMFGSVGSNKSELRTKEWHGAPELVTTNWWLGVIALVEKASMKRMIIDYCDPDPCSLSRSSLEPRQQLEILSLRTAFLIGPGIFHPSNYPLPRTVISWARHQGKRQGEDKFLRVRRVLLDTLSPFSICIRETLPYSSPIAWITRSCEMPVVQREAYDTCCSHIRGALASSLGDANTQEDLGPITCYAVATALFRLRKICLTSSNMEEAERRGGDGGDESLPFVHTEPCAADAAPTEPVSFKMSSDNSSQPDAELAAVLLSSSAKFKELLSILQNECGYTLDTDDIVEGILPSPRGGKGANSGQRKVVILASLPRTQWLVALLLGSVGIRHKLVRREFSFTPGKEDDARKHRQAALAWVESQNNLVAFNAERDIQEKLGVYDSADVLIVSPDSLASWHGGVGIDNADVVISLEEDWSGRELGTLEASVSRWNACTSMQKSSRQMIRLICENSIEEKLYESFNNKGSSSSFEWPIDRSGNHILYMNVADLVPLYEHALRSRSSPAMLPGVRLLRLRGEPLGEVLLTSRELEPLLITGSTMAFLPFNNHQTSGRRDGAEVRRELFFLRTLFELECSEASKDLLESSTDSLSFTVKHHFGTGVLPPEPRFFPKHVMSRSDVKFLSIRYFMERQVHHSGHTSVGSRLPLPQLSEAARATSIATGPSVESAISDGSAMADAWRKSGIGSKPDEMAKSLLFYRPSMEGEGETPSNVLANGALSRSNAYSHAYSTMWDETGARDGSQGSESVIFFPPIFPKIQFAPAASKPKTPTKAVGDRSAGAAQKENSGPVGGNGPVKRKEPEVVSSLESNSKRPRTDPSAALLEPKKNGGSAPVAAPSQTPAIQNSDKCMVESSPIQTTKPATARAAEPSTVPPDEGEEDYGLLGTGVLPLAADSSFLLANEPIRVGGNLRGIDFVQNYLPCDPEEVETSLLHFEDPLQLIALFVKMRPRNLLPIREHHGQPYRPHTGLPPMDQLPVPKPLPSIEPLTSTASLHDMNGDDGKKIKKKVNSQVAPSAFSSIPGTGQIRPAPGTSTLYTKGKDAHKHRMLATYVSRQFGTGLSMFESASFRVAMMHVLNRVRTRVDVAQLKSFLSGDAGPGIPLHAANQPKLMSEVERGVVTFTSIVQLLKKGSNTGDTARALATSQRSSLRRSLVSPCRVDFGPFAGGFLSSPAGMTGISPPRSRLGVSLPMGVKVTQGSQETTQPKWSAEEDKLLQEAAVKFGMNWIIVARSLSGFEGFVVVDTNVSGPVRRSGLLPRSARQCRDRWQSLARNQPSLAGEVRKSEKILRENALKRAESFVSDEDASVRSSSLASKDRDRKRVLLSKPSLFQMGDRMEIDPQPTKQTPSSPAKEAVPPPVQQPKRSFSILKSSMAKRQIIPLTIPPGAQPNQPVPSHPSHMQSVQSSVAAQWSNGRTEMWPLQILDCGDKHRAATRASAQRATSEKQATVAAAASASSPRNPSPGSAPQPPATSQRSATTTSRSPPYPPTGSAASNRSTASQRTASAPSNASPKPTKSASPSPAKKADTSKTPTKKT